MKPTIILSLIIFIFYGCTINKSENKDPDQITVTSYYFPDYHIRNKDHLPLSKQAYLDNQSEWELVKLAKPRFEGHYQPKVPAWGYTDEKDPAVMSLKIDAAADNGIDVFIFDWYNYEGKPFLNECLDKGFLKAKNSGKIKFALMWANHDWKDLFPCHQNNLQNLETLHEGSVSPEGFDKIGDDILNQYFKQPNYWLIDGKPYFSIYDIESFISGFGSVQATREAMDKFNGKAMAQGFKGIHWNLVSWGNPILPGEKIPVELPALMTALGFNSATSYVWLHHVRLPDPANDYNKARDEYFRYWDKAKSEYPLPYFPNVTMGWDSSPRTDQNMGWDHTWGYPYTGILVNNTPENFRRALQMTKDRLLADPAGPRILTINCWNEWTEGSYLEPDAVHGMAYLHAVKEVFGND